nr:hypothetical protein CFP56_07870 [Quercus suber]
MHADLKATASREWILLRRSVLKTLLSPPRSDVAQRQGCARPINLCSPNCHTMDQDVHTSDQSTKGHESDDRNRYRKRLLDMVRARTLQRKQNIASRDQQGLTEERTPFAQIVGHHGKGRTRRISYATTTPKAKSWSGWSASSLISDSKGGEGIKSCLDWSGTTTRPRVHVQFTREPRTLFTMPLNLSEEARQDLRWIQNQWLELIDRARMLKFTHAQYNLLCSYMKRAERAFIDTALIILPPRSTVRGVVIDLEDLMAAAESTVSDVEDRVFAQAWDEYVTAQKRLGLQYALVAEVEKSEACKNRDAGRRPIDYPPRDRSTYVDKEWFDEADGWFHNAQYLGFDSAVLDRGLNWILQGTLGIGTS